MSRILKFMGYAVSALLALIGVALIAVYQVSAAKLRQKHTVTAKVPPILTDAAAVERGRHIALTRGCLDCHGKDLGGAKVIEDPAMGRLYGPNLTTGRGGRSSEYADVDWVRAIRHGIAKDGHTLVLMPSAEYAHFTEDDLASLIAFLKSVPAVDRDRVPVKLGPVARVLLVAGKFKLAADEIDHATLQPAVVKPGATVDYGRYLAIGCVGCHGSNFSGGKIEIGPPDWPPAANLTPHESGRLAKWTQSDFFRALRTARRPDGTEISPIMPRNFGQMNDEELSAIWLFLKTLPAAKTGVR